MVDLMQKAARGQVLAFILIPVAVAVLRTDLRVFRARDQPPLAGQAQAALNAGLLFFADLHDLRVDQLPVLALGVDNHYAAQNADLRCGKSRAVRVVERLDHIVDQLRKPVVKFGNRAADLGKDRVSDCNNVAKCHVKSPQSYELTSA